MFSKGPTVAWPSCSPQLWGWWKGSPEKIAEAGTWSSGQGMAPPIGVMNEVGTTLVSPYLKPTSAWVGFTHFFTTPERN